jgi:hypothetical protein
LSLFTSQAATGPTLAAVTQERNTHVYLDRNLLLPLAASYGAYGGTVHFQGSSVTRTLVLGGATTIYATSGTTVTAVGEARRGVHHVELDPDFHAANAFVLVPPKQPVAIRDAESEQPPVADAALLAAVAAVVVLRKRGEEES